MQKLNHQQEAAQRLVLKSGKNVFISGFAGTGKTLLLRSLQQELQQRGRRVRATAFTGLAAQHLSGSTISKVLSLGLARSLRDIQEIDLDRAARNLDGLTDLIVDEVSMVSGDFLELIDTVMQEALGNPGPFGGIRMIFGGDFMQLPPVRTQLDAPAKMLWAFQYPEFQEALAVFLTENMRQTEPEETQLLNEFRQGIISGVGEACLLRATQARPQHAVDLYPLRWEVDAVNQARLAAHPGPSETHRTRCFPEEQTKLLMPQVPIGGKVEIKKGVPVILLTNDPQGRYVNGSQGVVNRIGYCEVFVDLSNGRGVWVKPKRWEITGPDGKFVGTVEGMPIQLGWAATIHRAQGMTLDAVITDISRCWEPGQAYVALSRTRSLSNIGLLSPVKQIKVDPVALSYVNNLF